MFVSSNSFTGLKMPKHSTASCIAGPPRRSYSTYTRQFQGELFCTVSDKSSDQTYKHRAFCKPPALRRPELRVSRPQLCPQPPLGSFSFADAAQRQTGAGGAGGVFGGK